MSIIPKSLFFDLLLFISCIVFATTRGRRSLHLGSMVYQTTAKESIVPDIHQVVYIFFLLSRYSLDHQAYAKRDEEDEASRSHADSLYMYSYDVIISSESEWDQILRSMIT